jgi:hypothetical protein
MAKIPFFGPFKWPLLKNRSSVRAEILCVTLKKTVLGLDGKNYNKDAQKVEFQFSPKKKRQKYPFLGLLNDHNSKAAQPLGLEFCM